jgi:peptide/nickel transport system substrate-binding protein
MLNSKFGSARVIGAVGVLAIALCIGVATATGARRATAPVLRIGIATDVGQFDPSKTGNGPENLQFALAYTPIIQLKAGGKLAPGLATSWHYFNSKSGANKGFEFTLRHDARFSDGSPVTANAVKAWLQYFAGGTSPCCAAVVGSIRSIQTVGRWTVRLFLKSSNPIMPYALSEGFDVGYVVGPKALADPSKLGTQTDGAGPYVLVPSESVTGDTYTYAPNPYYFDKAAVKFSKVVLKVIQNPSSMLQAAQTGQVDIAAGDYTTAAGAERAGLTVVHSLFESDGLTFLDKSGTLSKPLADVRVRQALNYAIDRNAITAALQGKYGKPTSEVVTTDGFDPKYENYYPYNPAKAKALLAAAGYPNGGVHLSVIDAGAFNGNLGDPLTQAIAKYLSAIGVTLDITTAPTATEWLQQLLSGKFAALTLTRGGDPMWIFWGIFIKPGTAGNQRTWSDPVLNKLWVQGGRASSAAAAKKIWQQMSVRTVTQADFLPVFWFSRIWYVSKRIGGFTLAPPFPSTPSPTAWYPKR